MFLTQYVIVSSLLHSCCCICLARYQATHTNWYIRSYIYILQTHTYISRIGQISLRHREKIISVVIFSLIFMFLTGALARLLITVLLMIFVCGLHMLFRPRFACQSHFISNLYAYNYTNRFIHNTYYKTHFI